MTIPAQERILLVSLLGLSLFGLIGQASLMLNPATAFYGKSELLAAYGRSLLLGGVCYLALRHVTSRRLEQSAGWLACLGVALAVLCLATPLGAILNGRQEWLNLGFGWLRISPLLIVFTLPYLARLFQRPPAHPATRLAAVSGLMALVWGLLLLIPDVYGAALFGLLAALVALLSGNARYGLGMLLVEAAGLWTLRGAFPGFHDLAGEATGLPSWEAVRHGLPFGTGFASGETALPLAGSVFLPAHLAEEFGRAAIAALALLFLLPCRLLLADKTAPPSYLRVIALGALALLLVQAFANVLAMLFYAPSLGVVMPLVGYQGTWTVVYVGCFAVIAASFMETKRDPAGETR